MNRFSISVSHTFAAVVSLVLVFVQSLSSAGQAESGQPAATPKLNPTPESRISFYEVPLVCPAAPQIGCGGVAKPLLLELEQRPEVSQAWLNRSGTLLAVVWAEGKKPRQRTRTIKSALSERELPVKELKNEARQQALTEFQSGTGWYHAAEGDRLSEEEAGIIAKRWVERIGAKVTLNEDQRRSLEDGFTVAIKRKLTGQISRQQAREEMEVVCRAHLDAKDVSALKEAFENEIGGPSSTRP